MKYEDLHKGIEEFAAKHNRLLDSPLSARDLKEILIWSEKCFKDRLKAHRAKKRAKR
jgi:hypothetical protein